MNENNNPLLVALNACIEDLVAKAIEKQLTRHIDDYVAHSQSFEQRVEEIASVDQNDVDANIREVVRNMTFNVEVGRY